jgi:predicted enzyme related to lactoylglutathione lyase
MIREAGMGNAITWFEILGPDPEKTASFYSELFGWHTETVEGGYVLIDTHSGRGMNGGIGEAATEGGAGTVFYVQGPDIRALLDLAESLGARTETPVTEIPEMVTYASFSDPWGNRVGLIMGEGDAPVSAGDNPPVDWVEIGCSEPEKAFEFYQQLFGWTIRGDLSDAGGGPVHGSFDTGSPSGARGGIGTSRDGQPHVEIYASVDDVTKYLERAEGLGGRVAMPAMKVDEETEIGMFADPQGRVFGLYA